MTRDVSDAELVAAMSTGSRAVFAGGDYLYVRVLASGMVLHLLRWGGAGLQLSIGWNDGVYTATWNYEAIAQDAGWRAALGWDGEGEPEGWHRGPGGRRRPGGDPAKEFVRP
jgi:hypothetical protein